MKTSNLRFCLIFSILILKSTFTYSMPVGDTDIKFPQPSNHEELCSSSQEIYQYIENGTAQDSLLITCFINEKEWTQGKGTTIYKAEIMQQFISQDVYTTDFPSHIYNFKKSIEYANKRVQQNSGNPEEAEQAAIDKILSQAHSSDRLSAKKGIWEHVKSGENFETYAMLSSAKLDSGSDALEHNIATVMTLINIKGKLLTLKVINSKDAPNPTPPAVTSMQKWVKELIEANDL